jgi:hypothetical protein
MKIHLPAFSIIYFLISETCADMMQARPYSEPANGELFIKQILIIIKIP